jgi:hypothetical protein
VVGGSQRSFHVSCQQFRLMLDGCDIEVEFREPRNSVVLNKRRLHPGQDRRPHADAAGRLLAL